MPARFPRLAALVSVLGFLSLPAIAEVRLHPLFSDHAVLQHGIPVPVWGWADPGEAVTVRFDGQTVTTEADDSGRWSVRLKPLPILAEGRLLTVQGSNLVEREDVVVGEVWVCSGQSNMEWSMSRSHEPEADIQSSADPAIRLFTVQKERSRVPLENFARPERHQWQHAGPETVRGFSAVAYYFGRDLAAALEVPIGLIHTSWGGSPAEVWMRDEVLRTHPLYARDLLPPAVAQWGRYVQARAKWEANRTGNPPGRPWVPSELHNAMIRPLLPYAIQGAIWYQGESNAGRAWQYRDLFADMIRNWRTDWCQGDFPFLAVQLAPWDKNRKRDLAEITREPVESDWAELREAQNHAARVLPNVGIAVITDVGDKDDIHPTRKQPVGARLALLARKIAYRQKVAATGPRLMSAVPSRGKIVLTFDNVGEGLATNDGGAPTGFAVAGADGRWHWAEARLHGRFQVILSSPTVPEPRHVRFGWSDFPVVNLVDGSGLPASPFRTDDFPAITARR